MFSIPLLVDDLLERVTAVIDIPPFTIEFVTVLEDQLNIGFEFVDVVVGVVP